MNINDISNENLRDIFKLYDDLSNAQILSLIKEAEDFGYPRKGDTIFDGDGMSRLVISGGYSRSLIVNRKLQTIKGGNIVPISVKSIYGTDEVTIPYGYKATHFGVVKAGQTYLDLNGTIVYTGMSWGVDAIPTIPRVAVILEKVNDNS